MAEVAVPYVALLARRLGSEVILLNICPPGQELYRHMHRIYLEQVADRLRGGIKKGKAGGAGGRVWVKTLVGKPADVISDYANRNRIPLVAMAAFGGSGRKTWLLGSVADKVVRAVNAPVLLVRTSNGSPLSEKPVIRRILLPLDGSEVSKRSLPCALELARKLKASITLFGMAEKAAFYSAHISFVPYCDGMTAEYERMEAVAERTVRRYLVALAKEVRQDGLRISHKVTLGIAPADDILQQAGKAGADLVVMATRGRSPLSRWAFGSVAEKVLRGGNLPLLLVKEVQDRVSDTIPASSAEPEPLGRDLSLVAR